MDVGRFKQVFDTLDEEGQRNVISQLSDEELSAINNYKPETPKELVARAFERDPNYNKNLLEQVPSGALEAAVHPSVLLGGAGFAIGGPVPAMIGAGIGVIPDIVKAGMNLFGKEATTPQEAIVSGLRGAGITSQPSDQPSGKAARTIGGFIPGVATAPTMKGLQYSIEAGLGAASAMEMFPDSQYAPIVGALSPAGIRAGANLVVETAKAVTPTSYAARMAKRSVDNPEGAISDRKFKEITSETGQNALLSARTSSGEMAALESSVGKRGENIDKAANFMRRAVEESYRKLEDSLPRHADPITTGRMVRRSASAEKRRLEEKLVTTGDRMYGEVVSQADEAVAKIGADRKFIASDNIRTVFNDEIASRSLSGASDTHQSMLEAWRSRFGGPKTIEEAIAIKKELGKAARGETNLFSGDKSFNKDDSMRLGKAAVEALRKDIESSVKTTFGENSDIFTNLRKADYAWHQNLQKIESFENHVLGKLIKKGKGADPEEFVSAFTKTGEGAMTQSEFIKASTFMSPEQKRQVARSIVENAQIKATDKTGIAKNADEIGLMAGGEEAVNIHSFLSNLGDKSRFLSMFQGEERARVGKILDGMKFQADAHAAGGASGTAESRGASAVRAGAGAALGSPQSGLFAAGQVYSWLFNKQLAPMLFTPEGQAKVLKAMEEMRKPTPPPSGNFLPPLVGTISTRDQ